jgi:uncharacterized protein YgiM (DUF1202 family)
MRKTATILTLLLMALSLGISGVASASNADTAKHLCKQKLRGMSHYSHFHGVQANRVSRGNFKVSGKVKDDRDAKDHNFNCNVRHGELTSWYVTPPASGDHHANAKEIGAGLLAVALIAAVAHEADKHQTDKQQDYDKGKSNPFRDMDHLKKSCRHEIRKHLRHDHGPVESIRLRTADLDGRNLSGKGRVKFKDATHHQMTYTCMFDRRGRIHDGHYHYIGESDSGSPHASGHHGNGVQFWRVTGVPANDVLNMRSGPSTYNRITGALGNGDKVRNLGCRNEHGSRWCKIRMRSDMKEEGWVNARYLARAD